MEIQMNDNSIVEMLETIFSNVNSWLNFAEAKSRYVCFNFDDRSVDSGRRGV